MDLVELKWLWLPIPDSLIIDSYKLWNTEEIITTYENEQQEKLIDEGWIEWLEASQAELENKKIIQWMQIAVQQWENHQIHLAVHWAVLKSIADNPELAMIMQNHMMQHESMLWWNEKIQMPEQQNIWQPM